MTADTGKPDEDDGPPRELASLAETLDQIPALRGKLRASVEDLTAAVRRLAEAARPDHHDPSVHLTGRG